MTSLQLLDMVQTIWKPLLGILEVRVEEFSNKLSNVMKRYKFSAKYKTKISHWKKKIMSNKQYSQSRNGLLEKPLSPRRPLFSVDASRADALPEQAQSHLSEWSRPNPTRAPQTPKGKLRPLCQLCSAGSWPLPKGPDLCPLVTSGLLSSPR